MPEQPDLWQKCERCSVERLLRMRLVVFSWPLPFLAVAQGLTASLSGMISRSKMNPFSLYVFKRKCVAMEAWLEMSKGTRKAECH
jgi:hypothetical protein